MLLKDEPCVFDTPFQNSASAHLHQTHVDVLPVSNTSESHHTTALTVDNDLTSDRRTNTAVCLSDGNIQSSLQTVDDICTLLYHRWINQSQYCTSIGSSAWVFVQPSKSCFDLIYTSAISKDMAVATKSHPALQQNHQPHMFDCASSAYLHMQAEATDQTIILYGTSQGSPALSILEATCRHLADLGRSDDIGNNSGQKRKDIALQIHRSHAILQAFTGITDVHGHGFETHALDSISTTPPTSSPTGCIQYNELQFDTNHQVVGIKFIPYLLQSAHIWSTPGCNFTILYSLIEGAMHEERIHWGIDKPKNQHDSTSRHQPTVVRNFKYTAGSANMGPAKLDQLEEKFTQLRTHLKHVGISSRIQRDIFSILAAILHLGNLVFQKNTVGDREATAVTNPTDLAIVAKLLAVDTVSLENALTLQTRLFNGESIQVHLNLDVAGKQRDALSEALYSVLFSWIVEHLNSQLCKQEQEWENYIAVLDVPGFDFKAHQMSNNQAVGTRSYYQFMNNFSNELVRERLWKPNYKHAELEYININRTRNSLYERSDSSLLDILMSEPFGIIPLLNTETTCGSESTNDSAFLANCAHRYNGISQFQIPSTPNASFKIRHCDGISEYTSCDYMVQGWTLLNTDPVQSRFVSLFRGSLDHSGTKNEFIRLLFDQHVLLRQSNENTSTVQTPRGLTRGPSMRRQAITQPKMPRLHHNEPKVADLESTVAHQFINEYAALLDVISTTKQWSIFTITPYTYQSRSDDWNEHYIKKQLQLTPILELSQSTVSLYSSMLTYSAFVKRYATVLTKHDISTQKQSYRDACTKLIELMKWQQIDAVCVRSGIYLSEKSWRHLEQDLLELAKPGANQVDIIEWVSGTENCFLDPHTRASIAEWISTDAVLEQIPHERSDTFKSNQTRDDKDTFEESVSGSFVGKDSAETERGMITRGRVHSTSTLLNHIIPSKWQHDSMLKQSDTKQRERRKNNRLGKFNRLSLRNPLCSEDTPISKTRRNWLCCTWSLTWWVPSCILSCCCGMRFRNQKVAWREKVAMFILIAAMNAMILLFIIGIGPVLCPRRNELSPGEISALTELDPNSATVYMYGNYYNVYAIANDHLMKGRPLSQSNYWKMNVMGQDVSAMFSKDSVWSSYCPAFPKPSSQFQLFPGGSFGLKNPLWYIHNRPNATRDVLTNMDMKSAIKGTVVWDTKTIQDTLLPNPVFNHVIIAYDRVYDVTPFFTAEYLATKKNFLGSEAADIFSSVEANGKTDLTYRFEAIRSANETHWNNLMGCMDGLFYVGKVDHRNSLRCKVSTYVLLAASCAIVSILFVKFLASIQLSPKPIPDNMDKFVICQVPCYTEDEISLRRTFDSLTVLDYPDYQKLLFVIADGMIIGSGNDRPTPRIVLDILGVNADEQAESVMYQSLGVDGKQINQAQVYSGIYETQDRRIPFIVVVKVGIATEHQKPGNRGKRDSQLILMQFLSRMHYKSPMNPLELEINHHMKNIIGVDAHLYEFILMVDADTNVTPSALTQLVAAMKSDGRIIGICGETQVSNERDSWVTMIQVYEYFISHHLSKAFESLFGSVTCLPGCFSLYRIRSSASNKPYLIHNHVLKDYCVNKVDTLHLRNLLHLGEDRYLTTLMMKHFPSMKTKFTPYAVSKTIAPETWKVFQSQRRRWINSTVHNLIELLSLPNMCGTCCFSMRFVVFIDLLATMIQPAMLIYLIYLVVMSTLDKSTVFPLVSIALIAIVYGFQVILFLLKREVQNLGWMIAYLLAVPLFTFYLPIYSFWSMDNFSWGNTRVAIEEDKQMIEKKLDENEPDPALIPLETWQSYSQKDRSRRNNAANSQENKVVLDTQSTDLCQNTNEEVPTQMHVLPAFFPTITQPPPTPPKVYSTPTHSSFYNKDFALPTVNETSLMSLIPASWNTSSQDEASTGFNPPSTAMNTTVNSTYPPHKLGQIAHSHQSSTTFRLTPLPQLSYVSTSTSHRHSTSLHSLSTTQKSQMESIIYEFLSLANLTSVSKEQIQQHLETTLGHTLDDKEKQHMLTVIQSIMDKS
ncbi:hypothetical protein BDV3_005309 [Batrachochytrium dendrobatidis]|uniref:chitin synthase n=2 Tax=Batrachochytrium dendrobatidis TaxID=109871 RepID=A0A177WHA4_BATDL|nr:chitin synthase [Batrachochytrium dendrobatidis JEL423]